MAEIVQSVVNEAAAAARAAAQAARSMEAMMKLRDDKPRFASTPKRRGTQNEFQSETQWMFACHTRVQHIMIQCDVSSQPSVNGTHFRAACGVRLPSDSCKFQDSADPKLARCRHSGCRIRWEFRPVD